MFNMDMREINNIINMRDMIHELHVTDYRS